MTNTIDWNAPLEAYHPDGRVVEVELDFECSDPEDRELSIVYGLDERWFFFYRDGVGSHSENPWRIRNRAQPAPQYPAGLVDYLRECANLRGYMGDTAKSFLAELEPVDPDRELAIDIILDHYEGCPPDKVLNCVFAAIKRVRAEKG